MNPLPGIHQNGTALFWTIFVASCVACLWVDWTGPTGASCAARQQARRARGRGVQGGLNVVPILCITAMGIIAFVTRKDPALLLGLEDNAIANIPRAATSVIILLAFCSGRLVQGLLLPGLTSKLIRDGLIIPGGSFSLVMQQPLWISLSAGILYIGCQTFAEELFFRGLAFLAFHRLLVFAGRQPGGAADQAWTVTAAALLQALIFGLVHFLPAYVAFHRRGIKAPLMLWYMMAMPTGCAFAFATINLAGGSLWPGWIAHWVLNYASLCWILAGRLMKARESRYITGER